MTDDLSRSFDKGVGRADHAGLWGEGARRADRDSVTRLKRVREVARLILADDASIDAWLCMPAPALSGRKPMDLLNTEDGAAEVEGLIRGLAHGNFQ